MSVETETKTLEIAKEDVASTANGHDEEWLTFEDDAAFLQHIVSQKPAEKIVPIPEWKTEVLCKTLNAESRIEVQVLAYDAETKMTDYRKAFHLVVIGGCYNPTTGKQTFAEKHKNLLMRQMDGGPIELLALTILRLSKMLPDDTKNAKKN